jgi:hypothetical protein
MAHAEGAVIKVGGTAMRSRVLLLLPLALGACATGPTLDQRMAGYVGRSEGDLVANLGVPVRSYETEGRRFLQFEQRSTIAVSQPDPLFYGPWRYRPWMSSPAYAEVQCNITFALRQQRVESFVLNGQGCY